MWVLVLAAVAAALVALFMWLASTALQPLPYSDPDASLGSADALVLAL
jgi:hypothetical protein